MMVTVLPAQGPDDWEAAKAIRFAVFVDEQRVPAALELDEHDAHARHWLAFDAKQRAIGTARAVIRPDGMWKIGRVAVAREARGQGVGAAIMREIMRAAAAEDAPDALLDSQTHALGFYAGLGFVAEGPEFDDAGIPHRRMVWRAGRQP